MTSKLKTEIQGEYIFISHEEPSAIPFLAIHLQDGQFIFQAPGGSPFTMQSYNVLKLAEGLVKIVKDSGLYQIETNEESKA